MAEQRLRMLRAFRAAAAQLLDALLRHVLQGLHSPTLDIALTELQVRQSSGLCFLILAQLQRLLRCTARMSHSDEEFSHWVCLHVSLSLMLGW